MTISALKSSHMPPSKPPSTPLDTTVRADDNACPACGLKLPPGTPPELCPRCLLGAGLGAANEGLPDGLPGEGDRFGPYQLVRLLGAGGMGEVYEADDLETGRRVALKMLQQRLDSPEARRRFLSEGRLAASINHPNSVYVFGTEEIAGVPVIAMELMPGGTLDDRVRAQGPMEISAAVDAVLQIIDGLAAAQATGILHRDIKPSNCFLDSDGSVKIGDYGLSISTAAHGRGGAGDDDAFMGTPAFASPEQLRGDELTLRSDIYSVGVTLFYLLTARLPHEAKDPVRLLARVLDTPATSPVMLRRETPPRLGEAVLRCLEKRPDDRFATYHELRRELALFRSNGNQAAGLGARLLAGSVDLALVGVPLLAAFRLIPASGDPGFAGAVIDLCKVLVVMLACISYFALLEWKYGKTPGKALLGLRVLGRTGRLTGILGFLNGFARAFLFVVPPVILTFMVLPPVRVSGVNTTPTEVTLFGRTIEGSVTRNIYQSGIGLPTLVVWGGATFLLFAGARRHNGWMALHDWLTATRVVAGFVPDARPVISPAEVPAEVSGSPMIGPFHVLESLAGTDEWFVGYDRRLLRRVWLCKMLPGTPPVAAALRNLRRVGRLRWLAGMRSEKENWDAYEYVSGQPMVKLIENRVPWRVLRHWMSDLAAESAASLLDGTLPAAPCLEQVWITGGGRAKLLDFPAPGVDAPAEPATRTLFADLVGRALENRPLPLPVRDFLRNLPDLEEPAMVSRELENLATVPVAVSRTRRLGIVAAGAAGPLLLGLARFWFNGAPVASALVASVAALIVFVALPAMLAAALAGEGLVMRALGVAVVDWNGDPAGGLLATRRSLIAWLPTLVSPALLAGLVVWQGGAWAGIMLLGLLASLAGLSAALPERSLQDRLAGTWLVPR